MSDPIDTFRNEATEHLMALESALLELEHAPNDADKIGSAFRAMHTIKGAAGMVGFDYLSRFTHHLETLFDKVRNGMLSLTSDLCHLLLQVCDHMHTLLQNPEPAEDEREYTDSLLSLIQAFIPVDNAPLKRAIESQASHESEHVYRYQITITPHEDAFTDGFDMLPLLRELQDLALENSFTCATEFTEVYEPQDFDPERCYLKTQLALCCQKEQSLIEDVFMFVSDDWQIDIVQQDLNENETNASPEVPRANAQNNQAAGTAAQTPGARAPERKKAQPDASGNANKDDAFIRVSQSKLDALMDEVGELVILQASLDELAMSDQSDALQHLSEELHRLTNNLRDIAFDIRMLPIGSAFSRFKRLVRDLSHDLKKQVKLETFGAETELDKVVLDKLIDPLIHILRNSMDHGIESAEQRLEQGKSEMGTIKLSAWHAQGQIVIEIEDDGAGLDRSKILDKAIERGLVNESDELSDKDVFQLIFEAGFSTAQNVSDLSGRGVGMDVVKSSINALQGKVLIDSEQGKGTRISIQLPMTLSIIDGLMVSVAEHKFIIPLNQVFECVELQHALGHENEPSSQREHQTIEHREKLIPKVSLRHSFALSGQRPDIEQVVIVNTDDGLLGVTVDEVDGNHQTVIRSMGRLYQDTPGVMGATILGDGGIAMILELSALASSH